MWGVTDDPTMIGGVQVETSLMGPSIWNAPGPPTQSWTNIPPRQNGATFPHGAPYNAVSQPAPVQRKPTNPWDPTGAPTGGGWQPQQQQQQQQMPQGPNTNWGQPTGPPQNTSNWGVAPPSQQQQQQQQPQWGGTSPGGSYSDAARKGVPPAQLPNIRQNRPMENTGIGKGWGSSVDQGTPWETGNSNNKPNNEWRTDGTGHWGEPTAGQSQPIAGHSQSGGASSTNWGVRSAENHMRASGQQRQPMHDSWGGNGGPSNHSNNNWGPDNTNSQRAYVDPNPQNLSHWVPPGPQEQNNDMMWHDPNPKTKKVLADKGTTIWGEPSSQGNIQRWKESDAPDAPTIPSSTQSQSQWDNSPAAAPSLSNTQPVAPSPSVITPTTNAPVNGTAGWGLPQGSGVDWAMPPTSNAAPSAGWDGPVNKPPQITRTQSMVSPPKTQSQNWMGRNSMDIKRQSATSDGDTFGSDNVFHNNESTAPLTPFKNTVSMAVVNQTQPQPDHSNNEFLPNGRNLQTLTQQIADQLRVAVQKGVIDIAILNQPLPQQTLLLLNQLLQRVPRLEAATAELNALQQAAPGNMNETQQSEARRITNDIETLKNEIQNYQIEINKSAATLNNTQVPRAGSEGQTTPQSATTPADGSGGSKLFSQWKQGQMPSMESNGALDPLSMSDKNIRDTITTALSNMTSSANPWQTGKLNADNVDWSPPNSAARNGAENKENDKSKDGAHSDKSEKTVTTPSSSVDEGPKEFIPGQKWEWRDPKEVAEDPNATPGSLKQNPLSVGNFAGNFGGVGAWGGGYGRDVNFSISGHTTPTKMSDNPRFNIGLSPTTGASDPWHQRNRPPSNIGQPFPGPGQMGPARLGPFNRSVSSPGQSAFAPYATYWITLQNLGNINEQMLRSACNSLGKVMNFVCPPNHGFACVRFNEPSMSTMEKIAHRLQQELAPFGVNVQLAKDSDVERLLNVLRGTQQPPSMIPPGPPGLWPDSGWGGPAPGFHGHMMPEMMAVPPPLGGGEMGMAGHGLDHNY